MPGSGGRPQASGGRRQYQQATSLPLDTVLEIAARSDATTLVRCASTCWEMRRRLLRLRHDADRFVRPLLRGHLVVKGSSFIWQQKKSEL
jgi:hypothetical protein